jgi:hypothetical protein
MAARAKCSAGEVWGAFDWRDPGLEGTNGGITAASLLDM